MQDKGFTGHDINGYNRPLDNNQYFHTYKSKNLDIFNWQIPNIPLEVIGM